MLLANPTSHTHVVTIITLFFFDLAILKWAMGWQIAMYL